MTGTTDAAQQRMQRWDAWLRLRTEEAIDPELPVVDAHHHLWDRGGHTYLPAQYLADVANGHQVLATVFVECLSSYRQVGPHPFRAVGETEAVAALVAGSADQSPTRLCAGIVAHADLALGAAVGEVLDAHAAAGGGRFRGIRYATAWDADPNVHGAYPNHAGMLREPAVQLATRQLVQRGLSLDVWLYFHQLDEVLELAGICPDLPIVIDHCGGPIGSGPYAGQRDTVLRRWSDAMQKFRRLDQVTLKFGGLAMPIAGFGWRALDVPPSSDQLAAAWKPYFETCLDVFGADRCMFESNFPVDRGGCSFTVLWNAFKKLSAGLSEAERAALCAGTARRVYRL